MPDDTPDWVILVYRSGNESLPLKPIQAKNLMDLQRTGWMRVAYRVNIYLKEKRRGA